MRIVGNIVGVVLVLLGILWTLQGTNVIAGSMMSGVTMWAIIGPIVAIVGAVVLVWINRRGR
ncbi:MAG: hypothetical protein ABL879_06325 [Devosia sp.]